MTPPSKNTKTTSDEFRWIEIEPGYWCDESSGLIWGPEIGEFNFDDAQKEAAKREEHGLKWSAPTKKDWMLAEVHDIREVLDLKNKWFWSSSPSIDYAWFFSGNDGAVSDYFRDYHSTVRCVGRKS